MMSIGSLGLNGLDKTQIQASNKFSPSALSPLQARFPSMDARLVAARLPGLAMYGSPYAAPNFPAYLPYGPAAVAAAAADPSAFYPSMTPGENAEAWRVGLSQTAAAYFDPAMAAHYGYGYGPMGLSDGARRKNATRETTSTLKAWLNEHRKNPYPTKGEKIMLAIITKMTLTQVSTWFANARRRLKKENKMTWSPRNRCGEDDDDDDDLADDHGNVNLHSRSSSPLTPTNLPPNVLSAHSSNQRQFNAHSSGGESVSDEGINYNEARNETLRLALKTERDTNENGGEKPTMPAALRQNSLDESRTRSTSPHLARQQAHPYANSRSSPSFGAFSTSMSTSMQSALNRPNLPFPTTLPHLPGGPHPNMVHPSVAGQFNPAAAASLLAASRVHPLPPHLMAALSEQIQYQQALQAFPMNSFLASSAETNKISSNTNTSPCPSSSSHVSSTSPSTITKSATSSLPSKSKIWSIADVATSSDSSKHLTKGKLEEVSTPQDNSDGNAKDSTVKSWVDNALQHKLNSMLSGQSLANGLNPQQIHQLTSGLSQSHPNPLTSQNHFPQPFPGFADFIAAQEKAKVNLKELEKHAQCTNTTQETLERTAVSPTARLPEVADKNSEKNEINRFSSSPSSSHHGDSSMEQTA